MKLNEFYIGQTFETGTLTMTDDNIHAFATEYDPQYMHLDAEKASAGRFGGIIASGIQTLAVSFKLWVETGSYGEDVIAGTAMNNVKFIRPVRPGDVLHTVVKVLDVQPKRRETGIVTVLLSTFNERKEQVFAAELSALVQA
ncbi:MaoC family dehydratase [Paenibacillus sp. WLX2291]|uniref:MaoC family dehydratase n=1 Tax=Paenibacillus sp. WLX2291 TaxID=3296934 RepID=UPI003983EC6B